MKSLYSFDSSLSSVSSADCYDSRRLNLGLRYRFSLSASKSRPSLRGSGRGLVGAGWRVRTGLSATGGPWRLQGPLRGNGAPNHFLWCEEAFWGCGYYCWISVWTRHFLTKRMYTLSMSTWTSTMSSGATSSPEGLTCASWWGSKAVAQTNNLLVTMPPLSLRTRARLHWGWRIAGNSTFSLGLKNTLR